MPTGLLYFQFVDTNIAEGSQGPRVHRSVSMGQAGGNDLAQAARPRRFRHHQHANQDPLSGKIFMLLSVLHFIIVLLILYNISCK